MLPMNTKQKPNQTKTKQKPIREGTGIIGTMNLEDMLAAVGTVACAWVSRASLRPSK